jgi:signal transduction histidine kinase
MRRRRATPARLAGRIARLGDVLIPGLLAVMALNDTEPETERATLESAERTGREALSEMRRMLDVLREPSDQDALAPQPGLTVVGGLLDEARGAGLDVELTTEGTPQPLPRGLDLTACRIVQEGLTNAVKHDGPARAQVLLRYGRQDLEIVVGDDGAGGALAGMRERVALYGGALDAAAARRRRVPRLRAAAPRAPRRVSIADDQQLVRAGFALILKP